MNHQLSYVVYKIFKNIEYDDIFYRATCLSSMTLVSIHIKSLQNCLLLLLSCFLDVPSTLTLLEKEKLNY